MDSILSLTEEQWDIIIAHSGIERSDALSYGAQGCSAQSQIVDRWLRDLCKPYIAQIERDNAAIWSQCEKRVIPLCSHGYDPTWLATQLRDIAKVGGSAFLFAGSDGISSLIRAGTSSRFSHVALSAFTLCANTSDYAPRDRGVLLAEQMMLWQSYSQVPSRANYPNSATFIPGALTNWGADMSDLAQFIVHYVRTDPCARFVVRPLAEPLSSSEELSYFSAIDRLIAEKVVYPNIANLALMFLRNRCPCLRRLCDFLLGEDEAIPERKGEFCSMLAAHTLGSTRVLDARAFDSYVPGDFSRDFAHRSTQPMYRASDGSRAVLFADREIELSFV